MKTHTTGSNAGLPTVKALVMQILAHSFHDLFSCVCTEIPQSLCNIVQAYMGCHLYTLLYYINTSKENWICIHYHEVQTCSLHLLLRSQDKIYFGKVYSFQFQVSATDSMVVYTQALRNVSLKSPEDNCP